MFDAGLNSDIRLPGRVAVLGPLNARSGMSRAGIEPLDRKYGMCRTAPLDRYGRVERLLNQTAKTEISEQWAPALESNTDYEYIL